MIDFNSTLVQVPRPPNADDVRRCAVALALYADGLDVGPQRVFRYLKLVGPGITEDYVRWPKYSGCGLVAEGFHRLMQVDADVLYQPYVPGTAASGDYAITRAIAYAKRMGAWTDAGDSLAGIPAPSSYVVIGCRGKHGQEMYGGTPHVLTVTGFNQEFGVVTSVDGGQAGHHGESIARRERHWEIRRGRPFLVDKADQGRYVLGWIDVDRLAYRDGPVTVPEGWEDVEV